MNFYHQLSVEEQRLKKKKCLKRCSEKNVILLMRRYLDPDFFEKHFNYNTLREMLESLDNTKSTYKNGGKVSLIKSGLRDLKN